MASEMTISQLAFVLESGAEEPEVIVAGCLARVTTGKAKAIWKVYPRDPRSKLIHRLFLLAQLAYRKLLGRYHPPIAESRHTNEPQLLIDTRDPDWAFLAGYLATIRSYRKNWKRDKNLPKELREFVPSEEMFWPSGRPENRWVRHSAALRPETFAFITMDDFTALTSLGDIPQDPQGTVVPLEQEAIESNRLFGVQTLSMLAERVRRHDVLRTYSWQELYLKTLLRRLNLPETRIPLYAIERKRPEALPYEDQPELPEFPRPLRLSRALQHQQTVLLTGPGGAGKTTALKLLARELAARWLGKRRKGKARKQPNYSPAWFPIFVRLDIGHAGGKVDFGEIVAQNVVAVLEDCAKPELTRCESVAKLPDHPSLSSEQMLKHVRDGVLTWARSGQARSDGNLFLLDRLDNVPYYHRQQLAIQLRGWISEPDVHSGSVLAARSWGWQALTAVLHLQLGPVRIEDVQAFLRKRLGTGRADLAWAHIGRIPKALEFLRIPFFLVGVVRVWEPAEEIRPFASRASLIEAIIEEAAARKLAEEAISGDITLRTRNAVLGVLGYRQLEDLISGTPDALTTSSEEESEEQPGSVWDQLDQLQADGYPVQMVLQEAEVCGILSDSGLYRSGGVPTFAHDHFRDYFAALSLSPLGPDALLAKLEEFLEFFDWDEPIAMLVELLNDARLISTVILSASNVDAALACECAARARHLQGTTMTELLQRIASCARVSGRVLYGSSRLGTSQAPLPAVLSRVDERALLQLYNSGDTPYPMWDAVPAALVLQGKSFLDKLGGLPSGEHGERAFFASLQALQLLGTPEAFELALRVFALLLGFEGNTPHSPHTSAHGQWLLYRWPVPVPLYSLVDWIEHFEDERMRGAVACGLPNAASATGEALALLCPLLAHPDDFVVSHVLQAIGQVGGTEATKLVIHYIHKYLPRPPSGLVDSPFDTALMTLARIAPHEAESLLIDLLYRADVVLGDAQVDACIRLLGEMHLPTSLNCLLDILAHRHCPRIYEALSRFQDDPSAKQALGELFLNHPLEHVRDKAAMVLGLMGHLSAADRLLQIIQRPVPSDPEEKARESMFVFSVLDRPEAPGLAAVHWSKCRYAARAIAGLGYKDAAPTLLSLAEDSEVPWEVRRECLEGLGRMGYLPAFQASVNLMDEAEGRFAAQRSLVELGASVTLEESKLVLRQLKAEWEDGGAHAEDFCQIAEETVERRRRRFREVLAGWPLGLPPAGDEPLPSWLAEAAQYP